MAKINNPKKFDELPTSRRHVAIMEDIENQNQTDRAVAIIGAAYVDLVLRDAITARLLSNDELMENLFENRGPLQEFGSRIQLAFALKIFGRAAYRDLRAIKDIRNAFAHSADAMDFNHQDIARLCDGLWYPRKIQYKNRPKPATPREFYVRAVALITDLLHQDSLRRNGGMLNGDGLIMAPGPSATKQR
jgi:DNA-binding MltR family transcriptional regulator